MRNAGWGGMLIAVLMLSGGGLVAGEGATIAEGGTRTLTGEVFDGRTGEPVSGAVVHLDGRTKKVAVTSHDGGFRLSCPASGQNYREVTVRAVGYGEVVALLGDEARRIRILPDFFVAGRVLDGDGRPVEGARVRTVGTHFSQRLYATYEQRSETGTDGGFRIEKLTRAVRAHSLVVEKAGFAFLVVPFPSPADPEVGSFEAGDLVMVPGRSAEAVVLDGAGLPVSGAKVSISPVGDDGIHSPIRRVAVADGAGEVRFPDLAPGRYRLVTARIPGCPAVSSAADLTGDRARASVVLRPGGATLTVLVRDHEGVPLSGARVASSNPMVHLLTGPDGVARFCGLPIRMLWMWVTPPEGGEVPLFKGRTRRLTPLGQEVEVRLRRVSMIRGVVLGPDGEPVAGTALVARLPDFHRHPISSATTGADGSFALDAPEGIEVDVAVELRGPVGDPKAGKVTRPDVELSGSAEGVAAPRSGLVIRLRRP